MSVQVTWENEEKTVLRYVYLKGWNWENLYEAAHQAKDMMNSVSHPVISIIDYSAGGIFPSGIPVHFRSIVRLTSSENNSGINVVMAGKLGNAVVKSFINLFERTSPDSIKNTQWIPADNLEEAKRLAQEKVEELKNR